MLAAPRLTFALVARCLTVHLLLGLVPGTVEAAATDPELSKLKPFLEKHCYACHGPEKQKQDLRFRTPGARVERTARNAARLAGRSRSSQSR